MPISNSYNTQQRNNHIIQDSIMEKLEDLLSMAMAPRCPLVVPRHIGEVDKGNAGEQRL